MNVLALGAHFDDIEIGCGGALARHVARGDTVTGLVVTTSDYTDYNGVVLRDRETALAEGRAAARVLGYDLVHADIPTKHASFDPRLIELINKVIDERAIDLVFTHWDGDVHQDHQAVAHSTLAAARRVPNLLMYRSNLYRSSRDFTANFFVDITDTMDVKLQALNAHATEVRKFGRGWMEFWTNEARNNGQRVGVRYAEAFHLVKYLT